MKNARPCRAFGTVAHFCAAGYIFCEKVLDKAAAG